MFSQLFSSQPERQTTKTPLLLALGLHVILGSAFVWGSIPKAYDGRHYHPAKEREVTLNMLLIPAKDVHSTPGPLGAPERNGTVAKAVPAPPPTLELPTLPEDQIATHNAIDVADFAAEWSTAIAYADSSAANTVVDEAELMREPRVTAYSRAPVLKNIDHIQNLLLDWFPDNLRRAGGEARAIIWLFINTRGDVLKTVLRETSGRAEVDSVALRAGDHMRFEPAQLAGTPVPVWVQLPVRLRVQDTFMR